MSIIKNFLKDFFGRGPVDYEFRYFSIDHLIPLMVLLLSIYILYLFRNKIKNCKYEPNIRITMAALIITNEMLYVWDQVYLGVADISNDMPLHLCGIAMYVTAFMLLLNSRKIFEVLYFWIICGTINALLTPAALILPNYQDFGPTTFRYFQYFIGHGALIFFIFYMIFVTGYRINFKSYIRSIVALNIFAAFVLFINFLVDGNYLFLRGSLDGASALDLLPRFPFNIVVLEILVILVFYLSYLPWHYMNKNINKEGTK